MNDVTAGYHWVTQNRVERFCEYGNEMM